MSGQGGLGWKAMAAGVTGISLAGWYSYSMRHPSLPMPVITTSHQQATVTRICDVYKDYLTFRSATQVETFYEALGLEAAAKPSVDAVWVALRARVEGYYHSGGGGDGGSGGGGGNAHGKKSGNNVKTSGQGAAGGEAAHHVEEPEPEPEPVQLDASDVWSQVANVLMDDSLRGTYDEAFMPMLTGMGVDRKSVLIKACNW